MRTLDSLQRQLKIPATVLLFLVVAALAHLLLLIPGVPLIWQGWGALVVSGIVPGFLFIEWWLGDSADPLPEWWERILYSVGVGYGGMVGVMLLLTYLPGPILWWQPLLIFDGGIIILAGLLARRYRAGRGKVTFSAVTGGSSGNQRWFFAGMVSLLLVAGLLRFMNLHYSEFQGDETRALLRAAEAIQGYTDTLFLHKKGPGEILIPAALYSEVGLIHEAMARLPFTVANMVGLFAVFLLGWRLFSPVAGWSAAMLLAVDGYFIGFARIVQYQSIVFLMTVLVVLVLYRLAWTPRSLTRYLTLAAIFLATGLLAHYEAALVVLPGLYLLYVIWREGTDLPQLGRSLVAPILIGSVILAAFYAPFVLHPNFESTFAYITVNRIGGSFPYNKLTDFFERTTLYSSSYYVLLLVVCSVIGLGMIYRRNYRGIVGWLLVGLLSAGMIVSFLRPSWIVIGGNDHTWSFFALALVIAWMMPRFSTEKRLVWLWFGGPMILMLFFTLTPNTHVYGFFTAWMLIVGMVLGRGWQMLSRRLGIRTARWVALPTAGILLLVFGNYAYWYFAATDQEVLRNWRVNRPQGYWVPYEMPTNMSIFGFPLQNGWKAVGALYADGTLDAPFQVHGKEPVANWYTRGKGYCPRDHVYYLWHESVEPMEQGFNNVVREQIEADGYQLFGTVQVNEQPRLAIYKLSDGPITPQEYEIDDYTTHFDRTLSDPRFELSGPVAAPEIVSPLDFRFGESVWLQGYTLETKQAAPGAGVQLTLYWETTETLETDYSVFTQIIDLGDFHKAGQRDGEPGCNSVPTGTWSPGDTIVDRYYIPIFTDAPPGDYALLIGMYDAERDERLEVFNAAGESMGDALGIDQVTVLPVQATP